MLNSLVRTILSQNTTDITSQRAFNNMRAEFGAAKDGSASVDYVAVRDCAVERLAAEIDGEDIGDEFNGYLVRLPQDQEVLVRALPRPVMKSCCLLKWVLQHARL